MSARVQVDLALGVLDHQLVDSLGRNCGKVDDLEIGGLDTNAPEITAILVGGNAWRTRGRMGRIAARLSGNAVHVPWQEVASVTTVVELKRPAAELRLAHEPGRWPRLLARIPGAR
jgi:sporulation protein YlmC with PRC-barrel domain